MNKTLLLSFILLSGTLSGQTIAEKKAGIIGAVGEFNPEMQKFLIDLNNELRQKNEEVALMQKQVLDLYLKNSSPSSYQDLIVRIRETKENINILEESWHEMVTQSGVKDEGYALWHQPDTTLEQLVNDYGSIDYVYLIPPEIGSIQVSVNSNIPIPRAVWQEMLEQILIQNGVGIKQINPYLRALYLIQDDFSEMRLITSDRRDLDIYPSNARVSFVLSPPAEDVRRVWYFLEKFVDPNSSVIQRIGRVILIVGDVASVKDILRIYDFVSTHKNNLEYKAVPLRRVDAEEMTKILDAIFQGFEEEIDQESTSDKASTPQTKPKNDRGGPPTPPKTKEKRTNLSTAKTANALNVIALPNMARAVFLIGTKEEIEKAENIIREVESQVGDARDKQIFWYRVKHSDPEELAEMLNKIYFMMMANRISYSVNGEEDLMAELGIPMGPDRENDTQAVATDQSVNIQRLPQLPDPFYGQGGYLINPAPVVPQMILREEPNMDRNNFIVDLKTGSLVMVVESDLYPKLLELIKKLDVPKKQVQIEVMLFEKKNRKTNSYGLNLLRIGSTASQTHQTGLNWNDIFTTQPGNGLGILQLILDRPKTSGIPAYDISYRFLMSQEDVHINASPSVVTVNQVPAIIAINEEISINTGIQQVEATGGTQLINNFTRAQYGITISVTPNIHLVDDEDFCRNPENYVHMITDITFDTFTTPLLANNSRPDVTRRHITNEVSVPDGQSVIIGGLRRKNYDDHNDRIPFLGELPGIGKLFSTTELRDDDTEMFIFITPKIIYDPADDFEQLRAWELTKRPGDLPCFIMALNNALESDRRRLMRGSLMMIFGRPTPNCYVEEGEYDGR